MGDGRKLTTGYNTRRCSRPPALSVIRQHSNAGACERGLRIYFNNSAFEISNRFEQQATFAPKLIDSVSWKGMV